MILKCNYYWDNGSVYQNDFEFEIGKCEEKMLKVLSEEEHLLSLEVLHPTLKGVFIKKSKNYELQKKF